MVNKETKENWDTRKIGNTLNIGDMRTHFKFIEITRNYSEYWKNSEHSE